MTARRIFSHLRDLVDVLVSSPADGDVLTYSSAAGKWENQAGGGGSLSGFAVHQDTAAEINNGARWLPDTLDFASDDWDTTDIANGRFTVGTGAAGLYIVECGLLYGILTGGPADEVWADITINATAWNVDPISFDCVNPVNSLSSSQWRGHGSAMLPLSEGCTVAVECSRHPFSGLTAQVAQNTFLRAFRIGQDASFV